MSVKLIRRILKILSNLFLKNNYLEERTEIIPIPSTQGGLREKRI